MSVRTATMTAEAAPLILKLRFKEQEPIQKQLATLAKEMSASGLFEASEFERASKVFDQADIATNQGLAEVTEILCHLAANVIRPAMPKAIKHPDNLSKMLAFDDRVQKILERTIPKGQKVEDVIKAYTKRSDQTNLCLEEVSAISGIYRDATAELERSEKEAELSTLAEGVFNAQKKALIVQAEERKSNAESINGYLDVLTERVDQMRDQLLTDLTALQQDRQKEQAHRGRIIHEVLATTGGV